MERYATGEKFEILLWVDGKGHCPVLEYMEQLAASGARQINDAATLDYRLRYFADHGAPRGDERCRFFKEGIFELKAGNGARLMGFYHPNRRKVVVFAHGFDKPAGKNAYKPHFKKALEIKKQLIG